MKQYQFNEKPTSVQNLGEDIRGAARHRNDTYETPEQVKTRAEKKATSGSLKQLLTNYKETLKQALSVSTETAQDILKEYEFKKQVLSCPELSLLVMFSPAIASGDMSAFRTYILAETDRQKREVLRKSYNRIANKQSKIRYIRPIELKNYFDKKQKESFREVNGHEAPWKTESKSFDSAFLMTKIRGLQFGNSLTENERIYVSENLVESIKVLEKYLNFDFSKLGFSFGARGRAGSIAHYQDSEKVLAFNRGWDGALIHELGHAIDYHLGSVSVPYAIRSKYREKIRSQDILKANLNYYMRNTEIFARMFEAWAKEVISEKTSFMIFLATDASLPDFDDEAKTWFYETMKGLIK